MYGDKIRDKRKEKRMSQEDLAKELDVTRQAISKWEMDKATPTNRNLKELARVFQVDIAYFIGNSDEEKFKENESTKFISEFFWWAVICAIGFFFYAFYYVSMKEFFNINPKDMPFLILTIYMTVAIIAFPQAYKYVEDRIEDLDYNLFSKLVLPIVYVFSPIIVFYNIVKK